MKKMKRKEGLLKRFVRFLLRRDLLANKLVSVFMVFLGYISMRLLNDATAFVFISLMCLPVFFAKENVIQ